eukprot:TRINITY_DN1126_c0_g1_i1.p1 TRINITY_DN1126_c0_g1~~TRINITY_DN1126_c0_g1_i1.p1  ORF type:complete len:717 (-),score=117.21 TRINITY_DN1126_c0_g1_i1:1010-3160(-)
MDDEDALGPQSLVDRLLSRTISKLAERRDKLASRRGKGGQQIPKEPAPHIITRTKSQKAPATPIRTPSSVLLKSSAPSSLKSILHTSSPLDSDSEPPGDIQPRYAEPTDAATAVPNADVPQTRQSVSEVPTLNLQAPGSPRHNTGTTLFGSASSTDRRDSLLIPAEMRRSSNSSDGSGENSRRSSMSNDSDLSAERRRSRKDSLRAELAENLQLLVRTGSSHRASSGVVVGDATATGTRPADSPFMMTERSNSTHSHDQDTQPLISPTRRSSQRSSQRSTPRPEVHFADDRLQEELQHHSTAHAGLSSVYHKEQHLPHVPMNLEEQPLLEQEFSSADSGMGVGGHLPDSPRRPGTSGTAASTAHSGNKLAHDTFAAYGVADSETVAGPAGPDAWKRLAPQMPWAGKSAEELQSDARVEAGIKHGLIKKPSTRPTVNSSPQISPRKPLSARIASTVTSNKTADTKSARIQLSQTSTTLHPSPALLEAITPTTELPTEQIVFPKKPSPIPPISIAAPVSMTEQSDFLLQLPTVTKERAPSDAGLFEPRPREQSYEDEARRQSIHDIARRLSKSSDEDETTLEHQDRRPSEPVVIPGGHRDSLAVPQPTAYSRFVSARTAIESPRVDDPEAARRKKKAKERADHQQERVGSELPQAVYDEILEEAYPILQLCVQIYQTELGATDKHTVKSKNFLGRMARLLGRPPPYPSDAPRPSIAPL